MFNDVFIAGSGPAGLSLAAACAEKGLRVGLIAPDPNAAWVPTYASWVDALPDWVPFSTVWPMVEVRVDRGEPIRIERAYGHVDREGLQARLMEQTASVERFSGTVVANETDRAGVVLRDDRGRTHKGRLFVDATGHAAARAYQTAFGFIAEISDLDPARPRWMDFSLDFDDGNVAPSFLYALPLREGVWLVEETSLIRTPALPSELLCERLARRLAREGIVLGRVIATEHCTIPMDTPLPPRDGPIRFGSAAAMVHPATGYLLPRVLETAPRLAEALARALDAPPAAARQLAEDALWPGDQKRRHHLLHFGASALATLDASEIRDFFRAFFSLPAPFVAGFLGDRLPTSALVRGMSALFYRLPNRLRLRLLAGGDRGALWAAVLPHMGTFQ